MGSTRLPGKVLMLLDKKHTTLDYIINQLKHSKLLGKIIIATTNLEEDNVIVHFAKKNKIECFRGETDDVLDRYYKAAKKFGNKVWNASKFVHIYTENFENQKLNEVKLVENRWIINQFNECIEQFNELFENYKISDAYKLLYNFLWSEILFSFLPAFHI